MSMDRWAGRVREPPVGPPVSARAVTRRRPPSGMSRRAGALGASRRAGALRRHAMPARRAVATCKARCTCTVVALTAISSGAVCPLLLVCEAPYGLPETN